MTNGRKSTLLALLLLLAGLLALWLLPGAAPAAADDAQWRASYFNNRNLSGNPVWERNEDKIDHDWGGGSPNPGVVNSDNFSVRWTRTINLPAGNYRFSATMDDGMRVWIDDQLIIDSWTDSQQHTVTADRFMNAGDHAFRVEYYEAGGQAVARFDRQQLDAGGGSGTFNGWKGEYFNNMNLSGAPTVTRDDAAIDFNWGDGSPAAGIPADRFSVRWTRSLDFAPGSYRFDVFSDDGVRLWVNNVLVIDQWRDQADGRFQATVALAGNTPLRVEYFEGTGRAAVALAWVNVSGGGSAGPSGVTATVTGTGGARLNVRATPNGALIGQLAPNQTVGLTGFQSADKAWLEIVRPDGGAGWVSARYVTTSAPTTNFPVK